MATRKDIESYLSQEKKLNSLVKAAFEILDTDHSGSLEREELEYIMIQTARDVNAPIPTNEDIDYVFDKLDVDKDGLISFEEFKALIVKVLECILQNDMVS